MRLFKIRRYNQKDVRGRGVVFFKGIISLKVILISKKGVTLSFSIAILALELGFTITLWEEMFATW